jgi:hypothetical protein
MRLEDAPEPLRSLAESLFGVVQGLVGSRPEPGGENWYKVASPSRVFLYIQLIGPTARVRPINSVLLTTKWDDKLDDGSVTKGNHWYGTQPSCDVFVRADDPGSLALAERFIREGLTVNG